MAGVRVLGVSVDEVGGGLDGAVDTAGVGGIGQVEFGREVRSAICASSSASSSTTAVTTRVFLLTRRAVYPAAWTRSRTVSRKSPSMRSTAPVRHRDVS